MSEKQWRPFVGCCDECGSDDIQVMTTTGQDNLAYDGDEAMCMECGRPGTVWVDGGCCEDDEDEAGIRWHDEPGCRCAWCRAMAYHDKETARLRAELKAAAERVAELEAELGVLRNAGRDRLMECRMTRAEIVAALSSASGYEDEDVTSDMVDAFSHGWRAARAAVDAGEKVPPAS